MAPGDGFIDDEMWLLAENGPGWIEAGYWSDVAYGQNYFWAETDETTGVFVYHVLGPVMQADVGHYVGVLIAGEGGDLATTSQFRVLVASQTARYDITPIKNAMWSPGPDKFGKVYFGQELAGSSGARANYVFFTWNSWKDRYGGWWSQTTDEFANVIGKPPYGGWIVPPSLDPDRTGGMYFTECCLPP